VLPLTLTNTGSGTLTISAVIVTGTGFSLTGLSLPFSLAPNQGASASVTFAPSSATPVQGTVSIVSNASSSPATVGLSGTGVTYQLTINPAGLRFGSVPVGQRAVLPLTLTNSGSAGLNLSSAIVTGADFSLTGLTLPLGLAPNQSASISVTFAPFAANEAQGTLSIVSNASNSPSAIVLSGTGLSSQLTITPASLAFGSVPVGQRAMLPITLISSGSAPLILSGAAVAGGGFSISGLALPLTLAPNQSTSVNVTFAPSAAGRPKGRSRS
jgi:hypothetical protein